MLNFKGIGSADRPTKLFKKRKEKLQDVIYMLLRKHHLLAVLGASGVYVSIPFTNMSYDANVHSIEFYGKVYTQYVKNVHTGAVLDCYPITIKTDRPDVLFISCDLKLSAPMDNNLLEYVKQVLTTSPLVQGIELSLNNKKGHISCIFKYKDLLAAPEGSFAIPEHIMQEAQAFGIKLSKEVK